MNYCQYYAAAVRKRQLNLEVPHRGKAYYISYHGL